MRPYLRLVWVSSHPPAGGGVGGVRVDHDLLIGASKAMTLIVTVDLLGLENLTNAYGLLLLFQGCGFILGNPFAGEKSWKKPEKSGTPCFSFST